MLRAWQKTWIAVDAIQRGQDALGSTDPTWSDCDYANDQLSRAIHYLSEAQLICLEARQQIVAVADTVILPVEEPTTLDEAVRNPERRRPLKGGVS